MPGRILREKAISGRRSVGDSYFIVIASPLANGRSNLQESQKSKIKKQNDRAKVKNSKSEI
jgi:hypothetical protein